MLLDHDAPSETFIRREIELLRQRGWKIHVRYLTRGTPRLRVQFPQLSLMRIALKRVFAMLCHSPLNALRMLKRLPQAAALTRDLVETDTRLVWAQFAGITADVVGIAAETLRLPWVCSVHAHDVFTANANVLACRLQNARRVIACSQSAAEAVRDAHEHVEVIHHGVKLAEVSQPQSGIIFSAGRLEPKKGFDVLLRACVLLYARGVSFSCRIAGQGSLDNELRRLTVELGIAEKVVFVGWLSPEQVLDAIRNADVVALASRRMPDGDRDGIANVVLEAFAVGTPVVTTVAGAAGEVIRDNVNGRLVPADDSEALADALVGLLTDQKARQRFAEAGRQTIVEEFDPVTNIQKLETCFSAVINSASL